MSKTISKSSLKNPKNDSLTPLEGHGIDPRHQQKIFVSFCFEHFRTTLTIFENVRQQIDIFFLNHMHLFINYSIHMLYNIVLFVIACLLYSQLVH